MILRGFVEKVGRGYVKVFFWFISNRKSNDRVKQTARIENRTPQSLLKLSEYCRVLARYKYVQVVSILYLV